MSKTIGELFETRGEVVVEWRISDFFSLPEVEDECYRSPSFCFAGASWYLRLYPYGQNRHESVGSIGLYLLRGESGSPLSLSVTLGIKVADGREDAGLFTYVFDRKDCGLGYKSVLERSQLMRRKPQLAPSDVLTVVCIVRRQDPLPLGDSLFSRLFNLSSHLKSTWNGEKKTDVVLKAGNRAFPAHRLILESRSSVFSAMFTHDMAEKQTGVVNIEDIAPGALEPVLSYVYCAEVEGLSYDNVFDIYTSSDKYDFKDLKLRCKTFIESNLCAEQVCKVIQFAILHKDKEMERAAREYFKSNMKQVVTTDQWKTLSENDPTFSLSLVITVIEEGE